MMGIREQKGQLRHEQDGARYAYLPTVPLEKAKRSALRRVLKTFFNSSPRELIAELADMPGTKLSKDDVKQLLDLIQKAEREGR